MVPSGAAMSIPSCRLAGADAVTPVEDALERPRERRVAAVPRVRSGRRRRRGGVGGRPGLGAEAGSREEGPGSGAAATPAVDRGGVAGACAPAGAGSPATGAGGTSTTRVAPGTNSSAPTAIVRGSAIPFVSMRSAGSMP